MVEHFGSLGTAILSHTAEGEERPVTERGVEAAWFCRVSRDEQDFSRRKQGHSRQKD